MKAKSIFLVALLTFTLLSNAADPIRPDPSKTPGDIMPDVTVEQICTPGYSNGSDTANNGHGVRYVPGSVKWQVFKAYFGNVPDKTGHYEVDQLNGLTSLCERTLLCSPVLLPLLFDREGTVIHWPSR